LIGFTAASAFRADAAAELATGVTIAPRGVTKPAGTAKAPGAPIVQTKHVASM
jgi:hypothetical protein